LIFIIPVDIIAILFPLQYKHAIYIKNKKSFAINII